MSGIAHEWKDFNLTPPLLSSSDLFIAFIVKVSGLDNSCILTCEGSGSGVGLGLKPVFLGKQMQPWDHNIAFQDCTRVVSLEYVARDRLFQIFQLDLMFIFYALTNDVLLLHHEPLIEAT